MSVELLISRLLRTGVVLSLVLIVTGSSMSFAHHRDYTSSPAELRRLTEPGAAFPQTMRQVIEGVRSRRGQAIVAVGLLVLIVTPVVRVGVSIAAFALERDAAFTAITALVFGLLVLSFLLGRTL